MTSRRFAALRRSSVKTPWGPLGFIADEDGVVVASWFGSPRPTDTAHIDLADARSVRRVEVVSDAVRDWIDGDVDAILTVPVDQPGGAFQQKVWRALRKVRGGTVSSYSYLATSAGNPKAVRAAGTACAMNHVAPFVPCHRIIHADGSIGAYGFGADLKVLLLEHEGALL